MESLNNITSYTVQHLPIISAYARKIGMVDIINTQVPTEMEIDAGTIILGMVLDTLTGRSPLYRLTEFFEHKDTELLLGKPVDPLKFSDHNVARVLDRIYEHGTMKIFSEISMQALKQFNIDCHHVSFDTTSVSVQGDYLLYSKENDDENVMKIIYGHSKDHRPDLKQFMVKMLCVDRTIPVFGATEDGNGSDKIINNEMLTGISKYMAKNGIKKEGFIYIADSAAVTKKNLEKIDNRIQLISRLPATYGACQKAIKEAVESDSWIDLGTFSETPESAKRPAAVYRAYECEVILYGSPYRAVVVHSNAHDKRRQKRVDNELKTEHDSLTKKIKEIESQEFFCRADAQKASKAFTNAQYKFFRPDAQIDEIPKYKRGRPKKDGTRTLDRLMYRISIQLIETDAIEQLKKEAGCFVLITNVSKSGENAYNSHDILRAYKDQYGIEQNFGFIKNTPIVNSVFLKKAERIEVLALVLLLSLLVWRLIEYSMRQYVKDNDKDLPGWERKRTRKPTTFMLMTRFQYFMILKIGHRRQLNFPFTKIQKEYLRALGLNENIFTTPAG